MIDKPQPGEYSPYAAGYVNLAIVHNDVIKLLADLMKSTANLFISHMDKADYAYAPGKWTLKEALGHMIDTERIFAYRALCIARGEQQNLPGFEQDDYAATSEYANRDMNDLIAEFKAVRLSNLYFFKGLSTMQAERVGLSNGNPTSVRALAHMIAGHELHHMNIINERYL